MSASRSPIRHERILLAVCLVGGALLAVIGARYMLVPEQAARTFGVPARPVGHEFHYIIGLRNLWLGGLAIAFATLRLWRALMLWFAMGAIVCFADAAIAASSIGRLPHIAFHTGCGLACIVLAAAAWRVSMKQG
jgi:hypothetical protein